MKKEIIANSNLKDIIHYFNYLIIDQIKYSLLPISYSLRFKYLSSKIILPINIGTKNPKSCSIYFVKID